MGKKTSFQQPSEIIRLPSGWDPLEGEVAYAEGTRVKDSVAAPIDPLHHLFG